MRSGSDPTSSRSSALSLAIGPAAHEGGVCLTLGVPVLRGPSAEALFPGVHGAGQAGPFALFRSDARLIGVASVAHAGDLELATRRLYVALLEAAQGWHLCRIWNYVPEINAPGVGGTENYQAFSAGRSIAFEAALGNDFKHRLPAASAVGSRDGRLTVLFVAGDQPVQHWENALQVPAYEYPREYGPRAPSFARATTAPAGAGRRDVFVSGTSAIRGHLTVAPGDTLAQVRCTVENLQAISAACHLGDDLGAHLGGTRHAKVYLRNAHDLEPVAGELNRALWRPGDTVSYVQSDICRADLNVEIELSVFGAR